MTIKDAIKDERMLVKNRINGRFLIYNEDTKKWNVRDSGYAGMISSILYEGESEDEAVKCLLGN